MYVMHFNTRFTHSLFSFLFISFLFIFIFSLSNTANAQSIPGQSMGLTLVSKPLFPLPHSEAVISIDDYSINTVGSTITWYVDNIEQPKNKNERSLTIQTGEIGKTKNIKVVLSRTNAPTLTSSLDLSPTQIDVILEANTYVPNFYKGRALPSRDSMMRAIAVVHDGTKNPDDSYVYKWSLNSNVLFGGQTKGKNTIDIQMPHYDDLDLVVDVYTSTGASIGQGYVILLATEPELHFYEYSPLKGLSLREASNPTLLLAEETTLYAEPYFLDSALNEREATFTWKINQEVVAHESKKPNALTLRRIGESGNSILDFSVVTNKSIPQIISKQLDLTF